MVKTQEYWSSEIPDIKYLMMVLLAICTSKVIGAYGGTIVIIFGFLFVILTSNQYRVTVNSYTSAIEKFATKSSPKSWRKIRPIFYLAFTVALLTLGYFSVFF